MWFTKFYNIRWSQKESFNKDLYTSGVFEHKFFPGVGGGNLNELIFKILNARGELPRGMLKFRIDRPITGWAHTLSLIKKWFKWNRAVILSLYFKSEKKTFPALFNVIVTKNYSLCARYSNTLSES